MKKHYLKKLFVLVAVMFLAACFNPMGFDQEVFRITGDIDVTGVIDFTDVTAAVLMITNRSKTIDILEVFIDQPDWEADSRYTEPYEVSFKNKPKSLEKKAVYLNPSQHNYRVIFDYEYKDEFDNLVPGSRTLSIPLPLPRYIVNVHIFRNLNGDVVIGEEGNIPYEPDPDDTGIPADDPMIGLGSSPAIIPPGNRTVMATFIVVNRTNQPIESITFGMANSEYTMGKIGAYDRQSIALSQGTWGATVNYTIGGISIYTPNRNVIVVPSNDPQAVREHYMYFYRTKSGSYSVSQEWPPVANDHVDDGSGTSIGGGIVNNIDIYVHPGLSDAVLILSNLSKTLNVTKVEITQPNWELDPKFPADTEFRTTFTGLPKSQQKKAVYLPPSQHDYHLSIDYIRAGTTGTITRENIMLPLPRDVLELFIYRNASGQIVIDPGITEPDPDDTGTPVDDDDAGEGSTPAIIPPKNRTTMATFIVVNRTNSHLIDKVSFFRTDRNFALGQINPNDRRSIALSQGDWAVSVDYKIAPTEPSVTVGPRTVVVVPSNDPQAVREHYLHFYRNNLGGFSLSQEWPPFPNDVYVPAEEYIPPGVSDALLILSNLSNTIEVESVTITQPLGSYPSFTFTGAPRPLHRKAVYLPPSQNSYNVTIKIKSGPEITQSVILPFPRQVVELFIYKNTQNQIVVNINVNNADPIDTGAPIEDPLKGEGSSPAIIPPENRTTMGTFIIVNQTNSQHIDSVNFRMGTREYTIETMNHPGGGNTYAVSVNDRRSIALGQGDWAITMMHHLVTSQGTIQEVTVGPRTAVIVPSNDPQAASEHYMYFYRNNRGGYSISQSWPPFPNDVHEEDFLPPDDGHGRGVIKIDNRSPAMVTSTSIVNINNMSSIEYGFDLFEPSVPVQLNRIGFVPVVGNALFPILPGDHYLVIVTLETAEEVYTIQRRAYIKDQVVNIVINSGLDGILDGTPMQTPRVNLEIENQDDEVRIAEVRIRNTSATDNIDAFLSPSMWDPATEIGPGKIAKAVLISTPELPLLSGQTYMATFTVIWADNSISFVESSGFSLAPATPVPTTRIILPKLNKATLPEPPIPPAEVVVARVYISGHLETVRYLYFVPDTLRSTIDP
ncbi:MAG: hypothetical protein LBC80_07675, partial [Treponema sp.]|nr:hypothetical protein [Treponema sp.]